MHYYQFNIGDYRRDTSHLLPIEHYIYRTLIDWYYLDEAPIPKETQTVSRRLCLASEWLPNLQNVLSDFFHLGETGWVHKRIDEEIEEYRALCEKNKVNAKLGGRPKKTQSVPSGIPNQEPITNNQEPITKNRSKASALATRLPADWEPSEKEIQFCRNERPELNPLTVAARFKDHWIAKPGADGRKLDWMATWRNWVRNERGTQQKTNQDKSPPKDWT